MALASRASPPTGRGAGGAGSCAWMSGANQKIKTSAREWAISCIVLTFLPSFRLPDACYTDGGFPIDVATELERPTSCRRTGVSGFGGGNADSLSLIDHQRLGLSHFLSVCPVEHADPAASGGLGVVVSQPRQAASLNDFA